MRSYTPDDIARLAVRRRWFLLLPFAVGLALAPVLATFAPEKYRSETLIQVVPQRVPDNYVKPTVTDSVEDRLPAITEQILSRTRLERIITDLNLYPEERARQVMEDVVARMRRDVVISMVGTKENTNAFRVTYVSDHAETARRVVERLASNYIDQNIADRSQQADSTSQFLERQLADAKQKLVEHERKLEAYRKQNAGTLPTQLQGNIQAIQNANIQMQQLNESMNRALERRLLIERQIADTEAIQVTPPPAALPTSADMPVNATTSQQLDLAKARLGALLQRYTDDHFEVQTMRRLISELELRLEAEVPVTPSEAPVPEKVLSPAEAAQQKRILDLKAELAVIDHQMTTARAEDVKLRQTINEYQARVDALPSRESELVELTRDYSTLQAAYSSLLMKREDAMIAANLERNQIGESFKILDPAPTPERPFNQTQRLGITFSGAGVGLALGLLLIALLEFKDSSFRREEDVYKILQLPVLALVPLMTSDRERRVARRRSWAMDLAGTTALVAAVAVLVYWRLQS